jgi:hypothetical protein
MIDEYGLERLDIEIDGLTHEYESDASYCRPQTARPATRGSRTSRWRSRSQ